MSCDTSDPKILEAYRDLQSETDTDWLLLSYLANSSNHDVVLDKTGSGGVGGLRNAIGSSDEEVLFGLVRVQGQELLVTFVSESVVGVRRARTIVHSRAIAKLFPDHHSTLTISHASELSESSTTERLNLDEAHLQQVRAHHRAVSNGSTVRSRVGVEDGVSTHPSNRSLGVDREQQQEVLHSDQLPALPAPSPPPSPSPRVPVAAAVPTAGLASMELGPPITSQPRSVSHSQPQTLHQPSPIQLDQRRVVSSSALPPSPTTPNSSRFKNMLPKFARRRRRSSSSQTGSQPNSPVPSQGGFVNGGYPAPPVPPKEPPSPVPAPVSGFVPPQNRQAFPTQPQHSAAGEQEAAEALHSVRERSISVERETQDRFRREKLGYGTPPVASASASTRAVSDAESDVGGLPYDREDHSPQAQAPAQVETINQPQGLSTLTEVTSSTSLSREAADAAAAEQLAAAAAAHAERVAAEREREEAELKREAEERERLERERVEELQRIEQDRARVIEAERVEAERVQAEAERVQAEEEERVRLQAEKVERERVEKEERERAAAEAKRLAEEEAREKKRKVSESLENQFRQGGTLLSGWITVQSPNSMAWRRRWFKLQPTVLELFKVETDPSTIDSIPLGNSTSLSIWYEESQVKDSFKLSPRSSPKQDYYLFADSSEDLDVILQGLGVTGISVNKRE